MKAGLYVNRANPDQLAPERQIERLRKYAQKRGWSVVFEILCADADRATSDSDGLTRSRRDQVIRAARNHEIDVVLVWRLDCWGSSLSEIGAGIEPLLKAKVKFVSVTEFIDSTRFLARGIPLAIVRAAQARQKIAASLSPYPSWVYTDSVKFDVDEYIAIESKTTRIAWPAALTFLVVIIGAVRDDWWVYVLAPALFLWLLWTVRHRLAAAFRRRPLVAIWLRRFQQGTDAEIRLKYLEQIVAPWGHLVTLSDSAIQESSLVPMKWFFRIMFGPFMIFLVIKLPYDDGLFSLPWQPIAAYFTSVTIVALMCFYLFRKFQQTVLPGLAITAVIDSHSSLESVVRRLRLLRWDRFHFAGPSVVFTCPASDDDIWRNVVCRLASECDLIFLDYPSLSENLVWELRTVLSVKSPRRVVLLESPSSGWDDSSRAACGQASAELERLLANNKPLY